MSTIVVVPPKNTKRAPKCPVLFPRAPKRQEAFEAEWKRKWSAGVATLWQDAEHAVVERLCRLQIEYDATRNVDTLARLSTQINRMEEVLFLTPQARGRAGIEVAVEKVDRTLDERRAELGKRLRAV